MALDPRTPPFARGHRTLKLSVCRRGCGTSADRLLRASGLSPHRVEPGEHAVIAQVRGCGFRSLGAGRPAYHQCPARPRRTSGPKATPWGLSGRDSEGLRQAMRSPSVKEVGDGQDGWPPEVVGLSQPPALGAQDVGLRRGLDALGDTGALSPTSVE